MNKPVISRRHFLQLTGVSGTFLAIGCVPDLSGKQRPVNLGEDKLFPMNQFILIDSSNKVVLFNHRPEMGQGTFQAIPMILAEELEVDIDKIIIRQSEADARLYGRQMVVGSHSIQNEFEKMRVMGASAKEMLVAAASKRWKIPVSACTARSGHITNTNTGDVLTYGDLVEAARSMPVPDRPRLKEPADFTIIGQPVARQDIPLKTNGTAKYGIDIRIEGLLYASIERSPVFLGKIKQVDDEAARKIKGVKNVLRTKRKVYGRTREGVAVVADSYWAAVKGRKALQVSWDEGAYDMHTSETIMDDFKKSSKEDGDVLYSRGAPERYFDTGLNEISAEYEAPYQSHVPMEPMNATVRVDDHSAEFWGSTQNPNGIRTFLSRKYNLPESNVKINYTFMGGGFGRRSMTDVAEEAADLSQRMKAPVKVIWTREDDLTQGPFRNCSLNVCRAVLNTDDRKVLALEHKVVAQEIRNQTGTSKKAGHQLMGGITTQYNIPNFEVRGVLQKLYIPISYWRSVYHSTNPFAHESFIDELALELNKDPLDFRLELIRDHPRFPLLLKQVAKYTDWYSPRKPDTGKGVAMVERSGAHFAMVVEVSKQEGKIKPTKITTVIDLGICVNPDTVKAQTEGSIIMGLTACYQGLKVNNGRIQQQNFDTYPLLRYNQTPEIETHIIDSTNPPDGAGESGLPTVAPAFANAIFDLTGKRLRKLPFDLDSMG